MTNSLLRLTHYYDQLAIMTNCYYDQLAIETIFC